MQIKLDALKNKKVLGAIAAVAVVVGIIGGVFLVSSQGSLSLVSKAGPTATPRQVLVTNVDSDSFTVSWISDTNVSGFVKYGETANDLTKTIGDDRDQVSGSVGLYTTHYITVRSLKPNTQYFFAVGSGSQTYQDEGGAPYQVKTPAAAAAPAPDIISGKVVLGDGQPAPGAIVYVDIEGGAPRSSLTKNSGVWTLPLSATRTEDLTQYLAYDSATASLNIFVQAADLGTATALVPKANASPVADITLGENLALGTQEATGSSQQLLSGVIEIADNAISSGQLTVAGGTVITVINKDGTNHSITSLERKFDSGVIGGGGNGTFVAPDEPGVYPFYDSVNPDIETLKGNLVVAAATATGSATAGGSEATGSAGLGAGFGGLTKSYPEIDEAYEATLSVKLETEIDPGENIATSSPEIKLTGPVGQKVTITVHSDPQTQDVTIGADGEIDWTPPEGLEPGEHTLEIEYVDDNGVLQKIIRTFVVLADEPTTGQGGLPAFTATPSATLTPSPTSTSSGTDSGRTTMPSTESGVPESGVLTLTLAIFMMGVGLFAGGAFWQYKLAKRYSR